MGMQTAPDAGARPERPSVAWAAGVTWLRGALAGAGGLFLVGLGVWSFSNSGGARDGGSFARDIGTFSFLVAVPPLLVAAGYVALAVGLARRRRGAWVTTLILEVLWALAMTGALASTGSAGNGAAAAISLTLSAIAIVNLFTARRGFFARGGDMYGGTPPSTGWPLAPGSWPPPAGVWPSPPGAWPPPPPPGAPRV